MELPRYSRLEMERRWRVDASRLPDPTDLPHRRIDDLYLEGRLRLRTITHSATGLVEYKLGKKYERIDALGGPITTLYLTQAEHAAFAGLPGAPLAKRRYMLDGFNVDVFEGALTGLMLTEAEREMIEEARALSAPPWAAAEVTEDPRYWGWSLAQAQSIPS